MLVLIGSDYVRNFGNHVRADQLLQIFFAVKAIVHQFRTAREYGSKDKSGKQPNSTKFQSVR